MTPKLHPPPHPQLLNRIWTIYRNDIKPGKKLENQRKIDMPEKYISLKDYKQMLTFFTYTEI